MTVLGRPGITASSVKGRTVEGVEFRERRGWRPPSGGGAACVSMG